MGIQGSHRAFSFIFKGVSIDELLSIVRYRTRERCVVGRRPSNIPVLDVDASWIIRKGSGSQDQRVGYLLRLSMYLVRLGFHVIVVCDGSKRHHSKRATTKRNVDCYRNNVMFQKKRMDLSALIKERNKNDNADEKEELDKQIDAIKKLTVRLHTAVGKEKISVGDDLYKKIQHKISVLTSQEMGDRGGLIDIYQAEFQADSVIASRLNRNESDIALISDSDMCVLTGAHCLCIKEFNFKDKGYSGSVIEDIEIFAGWECTIIKAIDTLNLPSNTTRLHVSKYPIFNNVEDIRLASLFAVGLGSDVYLGGVHGISPKFIHDCMIKFQKEDIPCEELFEKFISIFVSKYRLYYNKIHFPNLMNDIESKNYKKFINVLVDCLIYEPGNYINGELTVDQLKGNKYINENYVPVYIHPYIKEFCIRDNNVVISESLEDDLMICRCLGNNTEHPFFISESYHCCLICNIHICKTCSFVDTSNKNKKEKKTYCYSCYASESFIEEEINTSIIAPPSNIEMFELLRSRNIQIHQNWSNDVLLDIYDAVERGDGGLYDETSLNNKIKFPLEKASYLQNLDEISDFDISNGGSFLNCNDLIIDDNIEILLIMLELINIEKLQDKSLRKDLQLVYSVFPKILIDFAEKSRLHSGYRLIKRGIMHATDPECEDLRKSIGKIVRYMGKIAIYLKHKVHASMKNQLYTVEVCFTKDEIVACHCTCPAGCSNANENKVLCVHVLPVLYQLTMLLFECLSENILHELAQLSESFVKENHAIDININLLKITNTFMDAIQYSDINNRRSSTDLAEILEEYKVGTERRKFGPGRIKDPTKLCPLRFLDLRSTTKKAKDVINNNEISISENIQTTTNEVVEKITMETYNNMRQNIIALHSVLEVNIFSQNLLPNFVGFKLLELRSGLTYNDRVRNTALYTHWKRCISLADCSEHPKSVHRYDGANIVVDNEDEYDDQNNALENLDSDDTINDNNNDSDKENLPLCNNPIKKIKRNVCVCCGTSAVRNHNATFKRIPLLMRQKNNKPTNDDKKAFAISKFRRNVFLDRLNVNRKRRNVSDLKYCNKHKLVTETFNIPWMSIHKKAKYNEANCNLLVIEKQSDDKVIDIASNDDEVISLDDDSLTLDDEELHDDSSNLLFHIKENDKINGSVLQNKNNKKKSTTLFQQGEPINLLNMNDLPQTKQKASHLKCSFPNCEVRYNQENVSMMNIPPYVKESSRCQTKTFDRMRTTILNTHRKECLKRLPVDEKDKHTKFRICNKHTLEEISVDVRWFNLRNVEQNVVAKMYVPSIYSINQSSTVNRQSRGVGADREIISGLMRLAQAAEELDINAMCAINVIQTQESLIENDELISPIKRAIGRNTSLKKTRMIVTDYPGMRKQKIKEQTFRTIVKLSILTDKAIYNNTGFKSKALLLSFIIILCKGDINEMLKTETSVRTWWEEWYIYFSILHCKSFQRWSDAEDYFQTSSRLLRRIFDRKMTLNLNARRQWPMFATHTEDLLLRKEGKWDDEYKDKRVIMWDCTDITIIKPMAGEAQRLTWSSYYNHNVGKGGIFIQLCNWLGTSELWCGGISDTKYFLECQILENQEKFIEQYDNDSRNVPWSIIVDRGFNIGQQAWEAGNQYVYQPPYSRGGVKPFTSNDVINGASIAKVRSGNERAVRIVKCCGYIKEGLRAHESAERISDAFLISSFNANFKYRGVQ